MNCWNCGAGESNEFILKSDGNIYCCECGTIVYEAKQEQRWYDKPHNILKDILSHKK